MLYTPPMVATFRTRVRASLAPCPFAWDLLTAPTLPLLRRKRGASTTWSNPGSPWQMARYSFLTSPCLKSADSLDEAANVCTRHKAHGTRHRYGVSTRYRRWGRFLLVSGDEDGYKRDQAAARERRSMMTGRRVSAREGL